MKTFDEFIVSNPELLRKYLVQEEARADYSEAVVCAVCATLEANGPLLEKWHAERVARESKLNDVIDDFNQSTKQATADSLEEPETTYDPASSDQRKILLRKWELDAARAALEDVEHDAVRAFEERKVIEIRRLRDEIDQRKSRFDNLLRDYRQEFLGNV
jgi:hypothetical protein